MNKNIKAVALDLDGTLLNSDHIISDENKKIINELDKKGIEIILCTGRPYKAMKRFREELGLKKPVICFNGASIVDENENFIFSTTLDTPTSRKLIEIGRKYNVYHHGFIENEWLLPFFGEHAREYKERTGLQEKLVNFDDCEELPFLKMMYIAEPEILIEIFDEIDNKLGDSVYKAFSNSNFLEVLNPKCSKAKALDFYLKSKGLDKTNLLSMGDGGNDREMLKFSKVGVVMENASEELKSEFSIIAPSNDENGVAVFLRNFFNL